MPGSLDIRHRKDAPSHSPATVGRAGDIRFPMMQASKWFSEDGIQADQTILTLRQPWTSQSAPSRDKVHARALTRACLPTTTHR